MAKISDLSWDLMEKILLKIPLTSLRGFRSTCKSWNVLSKDQRITKKHFDQAKADTKKEFLAIIIMDFRVYLMNINLGGIDEDDYNVVQKGKLISLRDADRVDISRVFHCDGLVLCITKDNNFRLVVWNPYLGQTIWIKPTSAYYKWDMYAIGYENKNTGRSHKILRFRQDFRGDRSTYVKCKLEIYDLNNNSWRVLVPVNPLWRVLFYQRGVSIKGNTYWFANGKVEGEVEDEDISDFLICFDFTSERFGPILLLPFHTVFDQDAVTLSSVGDEKLAVLFQCANTEQLEIWVTTEVGPNEVSLNKFLSVDMSPLMFAPTDRSFFIDEEKKVVVVFGKNEGISNRIRNKAFIIEEDGYRVVDLGKSTEKYHYPLRCSYVPSSLQIKQVALKGTKRNRS